MSHSAPTPSAPGTPLAEQSVGEIVAANPNLSRVFQTHDIGFCCQGKLTLRTACERNKVDLATILADLEAEAERTLADLDNPAALSLGELTRHIIETHHDFLRRELPRIHAMAERVAQVHGGHTPSLVEVYEVFTQMGQELAAHAQKEEQVLFPVICELEHETGESAANLVEPVTCMMDEHEATTAAIARLRELTNGYQPPSDACNTYRALFAGLADLEADTARHIHLENDVLFPRALERLAS
ncbi:MAG: iron-sulfur cluster repair di-iron protein [Opitutales bacterium]